MRISDWSSDVCSSDLGKADVTSLYGQLSIEPLDGLTINGGIRQDDHDRFGGQTLFAAGGVWRLPTGTVLRASYGEGFKAPTLYQMFSEYGNVALNPEEAHGWEAGVEQQFLGRALTVGATWFRSEEHTSELQSLMRISYAVFCLKKKK